MTSKEAKEFIVQSVKDDVDIAKVADAIQSIEGQYRDELPLHKELKLLRIKAGYAAKDIALKFNKSPAWMSKLENGEIKISQNLYNQLKSYYCGEIEVNDEKIIEKENRENEEKINFLITENTKLKELLFLYMPRTTKDMERLLKENKQ